MNSAARDCPECGASMERWGAGRSGPILWGISKYGAWPEMAGAVVGSALAAGFILEVADTRFLPLAFLMLPVAGVELLLRRLYDRHGGESLREMTIERCPTCGRTHVDGRDDVAAVGRLDAGRRSFDRILLWTIAVSAFSLVLKQA